jgi:tRNA-specific 2-thiouridylase
MDKSKIHVYVGMSGGVDSSVTAALLKEQGYQVTGVYMKNWTTDLPGFACPWADDLADAKRVAVQLDIPFKVFDFQKEYKQQVVDYMIAEYKAGRTPNPDIMCNQEIKFDLFLKASLADGADMIATGHYARISASQRSVISSSRRYRSLAAESDSSKPQAGENGDMTEKLDKVPSDAFSPPFLNPPKTVGIQEGDERRRHSLLAGLDKNKDQSYFLYRVTEEALSKTLLPIGELTKPEVREQARKLGLATAEKKDSQGICFVGKIGIKEFLQNYVDAEPGDIVDKKTGQTIGQHDGAIYYTIGQRQGLHVGGGLPFYVVGKDMSRNIVYVTTDLNDENLWHDELNLSQLHWINDAPHGGKSYSVRTRYRAALIDGRIESLESDELKIYLSDPERALTAGQSAVLYDGDRVLGGGIVV